MVSCILFVGDVMPGRLLGNSVTISREILDHFNSATLRICNLEGTITNRTSLTSDIRCNPKKYLCKHGISDEQGSLLCRLKIDCCNLANNHILDYGMESVKDTINFLNANKIKWFGFGKDWVTAWKPRIVKMKLSSIQCSNLINERSEYKVAIFGMADHFVEWKADECRPGINYFDINEFLSSDINPNREQWTNIDIIKQHVAKVRHSVDLIIFSIHWGNNFQEKVPSSFQAFAHALVDMGVDIIHGHSTHHVQGVEIYKGKPVIYGCGEFMNDYDKFEEVLCQQNETLGSEYEKYRSDLSFIYKIVLQPPCKESTSNCFIKQIQLYPIQIKQGMVQQCTIDNKEMLFDKMFDLCKQFNTCLERTEDSLVIPVT